MGTDNLHHKRRSRKVSDLARRQQRREPYAKVLIICEGEKTEPNYFNELKSHYGLNSANIEVSGKCGSDPLSVLSYAQQRYREESDARDPFDRVYCVFDKDAHPNYSKAIQLISNMRTKGVYLASTSVPCFEYWLLLHFNYTTKPFLALPNNSSANQVLTELKRYMPDYEKGASNIFGQLIDKLAFAQSNAIRALQAADSAGTDNPTTHIHELVDFLQKIKDSK